MTQTATPYYTMGFSNEMLEPLRRYTAETSAAYLLPYLEPGQRVLDFGCGPGTISVGLARQVAPGELCGVDMEASQIELARDVARMSEVDNATFHVADVTNMPFEDDSFDVAHCHRLLMHVPDTAAVLAEVKRVLKPGGIIACREMIIESCFVRPNLGIIGKSWDLFQDVLSADDGHPHMGKDLKTHLDEAGFTNILPSASFDVYSSPEDIAFMARTASAWFQSPEIVEAAISYGASTPGFADALVEAFRQWKERPGAICGIAFGEAIATNP